MALGWIVGGLVLASPPPAECDVTWRAQVVDADTGEGIPNAQIELEPRDGGASSYGRSDDSGGLTITGVCPGEARVFAAEPDHTSISVDIELTEPTTDSRLELVALHEHHGHRVVVVHDAGPINMASSEQLSGAELSRQRGAGLADTISGMAGVSTLRGTAGGMAKPVIRGQVGRRNLIVFDGVRHEGQKWGIDHAPEIDPYAAGRITVIKGSATTRYGPDAIGRSTHVFCPTSRT